MDSNDGQRRNFANRPETPAEQAVYRYIRQIAQLEHSADAVDIFYDFLFKASTDLQLDPDQTARSAFREILTTPGANETLPYLINRCFYTIGNLWRSEAHRRDDLQRLVDQVVTVPERPSNDLRVKRLQKAIRTYVEDETLYVPLKRQMILLKPGTPQPKCLGDTFKSYFFLYESIAVTRDIPVNYRQSIRQQQQRQVQTFNRKLHQYWDHLKGGEGAKMPNPTQIPMADCQQVIWAFHPKRPNGYWQQAQQFESQRSGQRTIGGFRDEFHQYVMSPLIEVNGRYRDNRFSRVVKEVMADCHEANKPLTEVSITHMCYRLFKLFVCNALEKPEIGNFKRLIQTVGYEALTAALLKILLFRRKLRPWVEDRFGILFSLWERAQVETVDWLIQAFEHMNVALAMNMEHLNYTPRFT